MRLGGPVFDAFDSPSAWVAAVRARGYRAAYCPINAEAPDEQVQSYAAAAREAGIVIAEVGAWSNPLSPDEPTRAAAVERCKQALSLADRIGARCCVNIAGSGGEKWDGPFAGDLTEGGFDAVVATVRDIVDSVRPTRSYYTLETMPWMYPDSPDAYLALLRAVDRKAFAAHLDPVNLICSPQRYFGNAGLIRECIAKLGPRIRSCHAKDIILRGSLTVHLDEFRPGQWALDYRVFLRELRKLDDELPLMLEHLPNAEEYDSAARYIRSVATEEGISL